MQAGICLVQASLGCTDGSADALLFHNTQIAASSPDGSLLPFTTGKPLTPGTLTAYLVGQMKMPVSSTALGLVLVLLLVLLISACDWGGLHLILLLYGPRLKNWPSLH